MSWHIQDDHGINIPRVTSFKMEHKKGKPAVLTWSLPLEQSISGSTVSLWRGSECMFIGTVYGRPTHFKEGMAYWSALAISDTFRQKRSALIASLNQKAHLSGTLKDCEGGNAGYSHIDRKTHAVRWVSLNKPNCVWDVCSLHERDSLTIIPIDEPLNGVSASFKLTHKRLESGMMAVGDYITGQLPHGIETYSGAMLKEQWKKLEFKALRAGYDIQYSELIPTSYQRANVDKALTFLTKDDQLVSIYYQAYAVNLLLSWSHPVSTHTTVTVTTGSPDESISLSVKDMDSANETALVNEAIRWMNAYCIRRSFTTQVKFRLLITDEISLHNLDTCSWARLLDSRVQPNAIEGPIVSYALNNVEGVTWADVTLMWAPNAALKTAKKAHLKTTNGDPIQAPTRPDQIVACTNVRNDADHQFEYYTTHKTKPFETFAAEFPMTQLEIGLHSVLNDPLECIEKIYEA